jgi:hypothetical protein
MLHPGLSSRFQEKFDVMGNDWLDANTVLTFGVRNNEIEKDASMNAVRIDVLINLFARLLDGR